MVLSNSLRQRMRWEAERGCGELKWEKDTYVLVVFGLCIIPEQDAHTRIVSALDACPRLVLAEPCAAQRTLDALGAFVDHMLFSMSQVGSRGGEYMRLFMRQGGLPGFVHRLNKEKMQGRLVLRLQRRALFGGAMILFLEIPPDYQGPALA